VPKIINPNYRQFLDGGFILHISYDDMSKILNNINHETTRYPAMGRALMILLFYTGCRPAEALELQASSRTSIEDKDPIKREGNTIIIEMPTKKKGRARLLYIPLKKPFVDELYKYVQSTPPRSLYFWFYKGSSEVKKVLKSGDVRTYINTSYKVKNYFRKWTKDLKLGDANEAKGAIPPYYLRHDRFSKMAEKGATETEIRLWKGATSEISVRPYMHFSKNTLSRLGKML